MFTHRALHINVKSLCVQLMQWQRKIHMDVLQQMERITCRASGIMCFGCSWRPHATIVFSKTNMYRVVSFEWWNNIKARSWKVKVCPNTYRNV